MLQAFEELESLLAKNGICIAIKEKLVKDSGVADENVYDSIVQKLLTKRRARGKKHKKNCWTSKLSPYEEKLTIEIKRVMFNSFGGRIIHEFSRKL